MNIKEKSPHLFDLNWWNTSTGVLPHEQKILAVAVLLTHIKDLEAENERLRVCVENCCEHIELKENQTLVQGEDYIFEKVDLDAPSKDK